MFEFEYRQTADLSKEQRAMSPATAVYPSNFLAYARVHSIIALASCNYGTEDASVPRVVRNLHGRCWWGLTGTPDCSSSAAIQALRGTQARRSCL